MVGHDRRKELAEGLRGVFAATEQEGACGSLPSWRTAGAGAILGLLCHSRST